MYVCLWWLKKIVRFGEWLESGKASICTENDGTCLEYLPVPKTGEVVRRFVGLQPLPSCIFN